MARALLTSTTVPEAESVVVAPNAADCTINTSNQSDGNYFVWTGKQTILAINTNGAPQTITIDADATSDGRDGSITTYSIGAGEIAVFKLTQALWAQSSDSIRVYVNTSSNDVHVIVLNDLSR